MQYSEWYKTELQVLVAVSTNIPKLWRLSQTPQFTAYDHYNDIPG